jgi:hypothetical protein
MVTEFSVSNCVVLQCLELAWTVSLQKPERNVQSLECPQKRIESVLPLEPQDNI